MLWHFIDVKTPLLNTFLSLSNDTFAEREKRCRAKYNNKKNYNNSANHSYAYYNEKV